MKTHRYADGKEIQHEDISKSTQKQEFTRIYYTTLESTHDVYITSLLSSTRLKAPDIAKETIGKDEKLNQLQLLMRKKEWEEILIHLLSIIEKRNIYEVTYQIPIEVQEIWAKPCIMDEN